MRYVTLMEHGIPNDTEIIAAYYTGTNDAGERTVHVVETLTGKSRRLDLSSLPDNISSIYFLTDSCHTERVNVRNGTNGPIVKDLEVTLYKSVIGWSGRSSLPFNIKRAISGRNSFNKTIP